MTDKLPPGCTIGSNNLLEIIEDAENGYRNFNHVLIIAMANALKLAAKAPAIEACEDIARQAFCEREKLINDGCDLCEIAEQTGRYQAAEDCAKAIGKLAAKDSVTQAPGPPVDPAPAATPRVDALVHEWDLFDARGEHEAAPLPPSWISFASKLECELRELWLHMSDRIIECDELKRENAELRLRMEGIPALVSRTAKLECDLTAAQAQLAKVRAETIERCAKVCEDYDAWPMSSTDTRWACVDRIRALLHEEAKNES